MSDLSYPPIEKKFEFIKKAVKCSEELGVERFSSLDLFSDEHVMIARSGM